MAIDNLGRETDGNATRNSIVKSMMQELKSEPITVVQSSEDRAKQQELIDAVAAFESAIGARSDTHIEISKQILAELKNIGHGFSSIGTNKKSISGSGLDNDLSNVIDNALKNKTFVPPNPLSQVYSSFTGPKMAQTLTRALVGARGGGGGMGGGGGGFGVPSPAFNPPPPPQNTIFANNGSHQLIDKMGLANIGSVFAYQIISGLAHGLEELPKMLGVNLRGVFDGVIAQEAQFNTQMSKIVATTRDFGASLTNIKDEYIRFGNVTEETGLTRAEFEKQWADEAKHGLGFEVRAGKLAKKRASDQIHMLKGAMGLAAHLETSVEGTTELFGSWSRSLQMSNNQIFLVSRSMKNIARETGVTGDNLLNAAKSVDKTAAALRTAASLSGDKMASIIRSATIATKYGVEEISAQIDQGVASFSEFTKMTDPVLQSFVSRSIQMTNDPSLYRAWESGQLNSMEYKPAFGQAQLKELERIMRVELGGALGTDPTKISAEIRKKELEMSNATAAGDTKLAAEISAMLRNAKIAAENAFGASGLGGMQSYSLKLKEEVMTASERLTNLSIELGKAKTAEAKDKILTDINELKRSFKDKAIADYLEMSNTLGRSVTESVDLVKGGLIKNGLLQQGAQFTPENFQSMIKDNLLGMESQSDKLGTIDFTKELRKLNFKSIDDLTSGLISSDAERRKEASMAYQSLSNIVDGAASREANPVEEINHNVKLINQKLGKMSSGFISSLSTSTLAGIISAAMVGGTLTSILGGVQVFRIAGQLLKKGASWMTGGTAAAAATATKATSAAPAAAAAANGGSFFSQTAKMAQKGAPVAEAAVDIKMAEKVGWFARLTGWFDDMFKVVSQWFTKIVKYVPFLSTLTKTFGKALAAFGSLGTSMIIFGAIEGLLGAWKGYEKTPEIFASALKNADGSMKEVTYGMRASATVGGAVAGVLDSITFGLLGIVGLKEPLRNMFSWITFAYVNIIEKFFNGIREGFKMMWTYVGPALEGVWASLKEAGSTILSAFNDIAKAFGFEGFTESLMNVSNVFGTIAYGVGYVIGTVLGGALAVIVPPLRLFAELIEDVAYVVSGLAKIVGGVVGVFFNIGKMIYGALTFNRDMISSALDGLKIAFGNILSGIGKIIYGVFSGVVDLLIGSFLRIPSMFVAPFGDAFGVINDTIDDSMKWAFTEAPSKIFDGMKNSATWLFNSVTDIGSDVLDYVGGVLSKWTSNTGKVLYDAGKAVFAPIGTMFNNNVFKPMKDFGSWIMGKVDEWFIQPFHQLSDLVQTSIIDPFNSLIGSIKGLVDYVKSFIPTFGFGQTVEEKMQEKAQEKKTAIAQTDAAIKTLETLPVDQKIAKATSEYEKYSRLSKEAVAQSKTLTQDYHNQWLPTTGKLDQASLALEDASKYQTMASKYKSVIDNPNGGLSTTVIENKPEETTTANPISGNPVVPVPAEKTISSLINTGAFETRNIKSAFDYDDAPVKVAQIAALDYNNVVDSVKEKITSKPMGAATKALYLSEGLGEDLDSQLDRSYTSLQGPGQVTASANMFTPEDAAEYVMQQLATSVPSNAQSTSSTEYLNKLTEEQNMMMAEMLEELKKFNRFKETGGDNVMISGSSSKEKKGQNVVAHYQRDMLRGNWVGIKSIAAQQQHSLNVRST